MQKMTFTDYVRRATSVFIVPMGNWFKSWGVHPDTLTVLGLLLVILAAWPLAQGWYLAAFLLLLLGLPVDALDGATARAYGRFRPFGAFLDSTLDRYADGIIFGALTYYFADRGDLTMVLVTLIALQGSLAVSYTRARAEGLGIECKEGWFSRLERIITLLTALFLSMFSPAALVVGVVVLAIGTQFTALQRILHVRRKTQDLEET